MVEMLTMLPLGDQSRPIDATREIAHPAIERGVFQVSLGNVEARARTEFVRVVDDYVNSGVLAVDPGKDFLHDRDVV
jgi:hypothetical protein